MFNLTLKKNWFFLFALCRLDLFGSEELLTHGLLSSLPTQVTIKVHWTSKLYWFFTKSYQTFIFCELHEFFSPSENPPDDTHVQYWNLEFDMLHMCNGLSPISRQSSSGQSLLCSEFVTMLIIIEVPTKYECAVI